MTWCVKIVNLHQPYDMSEFCLFTIIYARIMYMSYVRGRNVDRVPMYMGCGRGWGGMRHWSTLTILMTVEVDVEIDVVWMYVHGK